MEKETKGEHVWDTVFVDQLHISSLIYILCHTRSVGIIQCFEPHTAATRRLLILLRRLRLIRAEVVQVKHHLGEVQNDAGENQIRALFQYARSICFRIREEQLVTHPLIVAMGSQWPVHKVALHFDMLAEQEVSEECLRIGLTKWMLQSQVSLDPSRCFVLIMRRRWFDYLHAHARSQGVLLYGYRDLLGKVSQLGPFLFKVSRRMLRISGGFARTQWDRWRVSARKGLSQTVVGQQESRPTVAIHYMWKNLNFDPTDRSSGLCLLEALGIPASEVLLYDYSSDQPLDTETLDQLRTQGVRLFGSGQGIPVWRPTKYMMTMALHVLLQLMLAVGVCLIRGQWIRWYYIRELATLAFHFAYWYDFYFTNRVHVHLAQMSRIRMPQALALDALQAVNATYQYTYSMMLIASLYVTSYEEDIQFVFSPASKKIARDLGAPVGYVVPTGYLFGGSTLLDRNRNSISSVRDQLKASGANFILGFFDENVASHWKSLQDDAACDYEYLLKWLLSDKSLGIVFKPKRPATLFTRIERVAHLIERAKQTGRCHFLLGDPQAIRSDTYPAAVAGIADVCVGHAYGTTATLEAQLAGVPALLIDQVHFYSHPFYGWGLDHIMFEDWESVRAAVEQYRIAPETCPEFGDWSRGLAKCDPFHDGQANVRMAHYIRWVHEALKKGMPKQSALATASGQFTRRWGASLDQCA